jgi:excisionase family DNA binding protein
MISMSLTRSRSECSFEEEKVMFSLQIPVSESGGSLGVRAFFTRHEAARIAGVSVSTLDRLVRDGHVPFKRIRGRVLFPKRRFIVWCTSDQLWIDSMVVAA